MLRSLFICFCFFFCKPTLICFAQATFPFKEWVKKLEAKKDDDNRNYFEIRNELYSKDSAVAYAGLQELERFASGNHYFNARLFLLKAHQMHVVGQKSAFRPFCEQALTQAYQTGDEYLIYFVSWQYGGYMNAFKETELAIIYFLKANEINERLEKQFKNYELEFDLGTLLFHTHEYEKSIEFIQRALANWNDTTAAADDRRIKSFNTIGQAYKQLGKLDSALANYEKSMRLVNKLNHTVWKGINIVFIGEIFFLQKDYNKAKQLIEQEYIVKYTDDANVSAYALQLLARINLVQGHNDSALRHVNEALELLRNHSYFGAQTMDYLQQVYYTAADVHRAVGNTDSFYHYNQLYAALHDSLERVVTLSSIKMAQLHIDNEKNYQAVQQLSRQKEAEEIKRNFIIAFLVMLSAIAILILNRQRQKLKYKEQLALQQKAVAEANVAVAHAERVAAKEQLTNFAQNLIEKTILIEKLGQQVNANEYNAAQQQLIDEITHQTILTEDDWLKFKILFQKTHPGFFAKLKEQASDITQAEQRMAALTCLHLTTKQMAAVLGISPNSIIKAKQRLRQRFNFQGDLQVEAFIDRLC